MDEALNTAPCGFLSSDDDGTIKAVNATLLDILEYLAEELQGQHIDSIMSMSSRVFYQTHVFPTIKMHGKVTEISMSLRTKNCREVPVLMNAIRCEREGQTLNDWVFMPMRRRSEYEDQLFRLKKEAEDAREALACKQAELLDMNAKLETLTVTDGLTGLKNYRGFQEHLGKQIALIKRSPAPLSLLLIDADNFKRINDKFGHPTGDRYLVKVAEILRDNSREGDFVARYGGEEFAIILPHTDDKNAVIVAEKHRHAIESASWEESAITISIGVSTYSSGCDKRLMISAADRALYQSKEQGRNRVTHHSSLK